MRTVRVRVLPVPGPATITSGASMHRTAASLRLVQARRRDPLPYRRLRAAWVSARAAMQPQRGRINAPLPARVIAD